MKDGLHVIFGADRNVIPGLHVAALSVLLSHINKELSLHFHVFTDALTTEDLSVLRKTLDGTHHPYVLEIHRQTLLCYASIPCFEIVALLSFGY